MSAPPTADHGTPPPGAPAPPPGRPAPSLEHPPEWLLGRTARRWWTAVGGVLTALFVVVAGLHAVGPATGVDVRTDRLTVADPVRRVTVTTASGDVSVLPARGPDVEVERRRAGALHLPTVAAERSGDALRLSGDCPFFFDGPFLRCSVSYVLRVPAGVSVEVFSRSGDVDVAGVRGTVDAETRSGRVTATGVTGPVSLETGSGPIRLDGLTGERATVRTGSGSVTGTGLDVTTLTARTGSGAVALGFAGTPTTVEATTGSGSVDVGVPPDADPWAVELDTGSGDQRLGVVTDPTAPRTIRLNTGSGDISVGYAPPDDRSAGPAR